MLNELQQAFEMTSDGKSVKAAEQILNRLRTVPEYPTLLLTYLNESQMFNGKLLAAIELKIWCDAYKVYLWWLFRICKNLSDRSIRTSSKMLRQICCSHF